MPQRSWALLPSRPADTTEHRFRPPRVRTPEGRPQPIADTQEDRKSWGKSRRKLVPRSSHAAWGGGAGRDAVELIRQQDEDRLAWLIPERHRRMAQSPFTFFRGAAAVMAADLATTPASGISVQVCGDAHLSNFGVFGSPERSVVFDLNDFDETLAGPWEWDVKRMAASFVVASRNNEHSELHSRRAATTAVESYREAIRQFASMRYLDVWYSSVDVERVRQLFADEGRSRRVRQIDKTINRARKRDHLRALRKLTTDEGGTLRIKSEPPFIIPMRDMDADADTIEEGVRKTLATYAATLSHAEASLLGQYQVIDVALKVVGVGSVGTRCSIVFLQGRDSEDPLFLQVKEASSSVLEPYLTSSRYEHHGRRVVEGQRLMQTSSDIFLGWTRGEVSGHHYYVRQLWDMKAGGDVEDYSPSRMEDYSRVCGWTLAKAHARSGEAASITGYLGKGNRFDEGVTEFAVSYADQNDRDYRAFVDAVGTGD
ncbi:MAG: DUF2252 domain-containing protein [Acidimicrobiia bacterium]